MAVRIALADDDFSDWPELLHLVQDAFAYMEGRIDPPSSVHGLTPTSIATKSQEEALFLATDDEELVGCVFARPRADSLYVSKLAVRPERQGNDIGRRLMQAVEDHARSIGIRTVELDTRIELIENHRTFVALGYLKTAEQAHEGFDHPTFITMRKLL